MGCAASSQGDGGASAKSSRVSSPTGSSPRRPRQRAFNVVATRGEMGHVDAVHIISTPTPSVSAADVAVRDALPLQAKRGDPPGRALNIGGGELSFSCDSGAPTGDQSAPSACRKGARGPGGLEGLEGASHRTILTPELQPSPNTTTTTTISSDGPSGSSRSVTRTFRNSSLSESSREHGLEHWSNEASVVGSGSGSELHHSNDKLRDSLPLDPMATASIPTVQPHASIASFGATTGCDTTEGAAGQERHPRRPSSHRNAAAAKSVPRRAATSSDSDSDGEVVEVRPLEVSPLVRQIESPQVVPEMPLT